MWSSDAHSQGGSYPTQWALNPSAYMNVPNEQVDWATLAQQWIKMKEGVPPAEKEEGEAPMEITKEDNTPTEIPQETTTSQQPWQSSNPPLDGAWPNNWNWDQGGGWCWGDVGSGEAKVPPSTYNPGYTSVPVEPAVPHNQVVAPQPSYNTFTPQPAAPTQHYPNNPGYWTGSSNVKETWESPSTRTSRKHQHNPEPVPELDSAKRKQLPAWIREGLEKMEREKQKKAESERLERERREHLREHKIEEEKKEYVETNGSPALPKKSKFETDSEDSENEKDNLIGEKNVERIQRNRFDWRGPDTTPPKTVFRSKEDILQHVMIQVRKILTQLLTEVTTDEMMAVCEQVHNQYQRKAPATTVRKTQALASLTGKLGLGIYDSDSGSESSEAEGIANGADSDQELRDRIKRRKEEFVETERRIEREIAEQEEKERRVLLGKRSVSREGSPDIEEQVQPPQQGAASDLKLEGKSTKEPLESKNIEGKEHKGEARERNEIKKDPDKLVKKSDRKSHKHSSVSSSSSDYSRSPSPYKRHKHSRHRKDKRSRRTRSKSRSREKSRSRSRERRKEHRRKERRYRSRSSSRGRRRRSIERRGRHRSSSSSSGGNHKRLSHRR